MPLDPQLAVLLDLINAGTPLHQQSVVDARATFRKLTLGPRTPEQVLPVDAVSELTVAGRPARVYRNGSDPAPVVVLFHGGGFVVGDLDTHDQMARALVGGTGAIVVSVDYRMAPEHPFPAAVEDAVAATRWVLEHGAELGGNGRVAVAGDSAGGNLSAVVAQQVPGLAAQFLIYPATDVLGDYPSRHQNATGYFLDEPTMAWFITRYATAESDYTDPRLSPLLGVRAGLPPAVVVTAELDPLRDEGEAYADALAAAGVPVTKRRYDGQIHGFADMGPWSTASQAAWDDAIGLFAELLRPR